MIIQALEPVSEGLLVHIDGFDSEVRRQTKVRLSI
jgi:hypothetical protein